MADYKRVVILKVAVNPFFLVIQRNKLASTSNVSGFVYCYAYIDIFYKDIELRDGERREESKINNKR